MWFARVGADEQPRADLPVAQAPGQQREHLHLPRGEVRRAGAGAQPVEPAQHPDLADRLRQSPPRLRSERAGAGRVGRAVQRGVGISMTRA